MGNENRNNINALKTGYYSSILLAFVTFITFAVAMKAVRELPLSPLTGCL